VVEAAGMAQGAEQMEADSGLGSESPQDPSDLGDSTSMVLVNKDVGYSTRR